MYFHFHGVNFNDRQEAQFRGFLGQTGLTASEAIRRMVDYCLQERVKDAIVPAMSGQFAERRAG